MKKNANLLFFVIICMSLLFTGCPNPDDDDAPKLPQSGAWNGSDLHLFVSDDGTELTTTGSTLEEGASLIVVASGNTCAGSVTMTKYYYSDFQITDMSFSYTSADDDITGTFSHNDVCTADGYIGGTMYYPTSCDFSLEFNNIMATPESIDSDSTKSAEISTAIDYYPDGKLKSRVIYK